MPFELSIRQIANLEITHATKCRSRELPANLFFSVVWCDKEESACCVTWCAEGEIEQTDDAGVDRCRVLDLEGRRHAWLSAFEPEDIDQPNGIRTGHCCNRVR